MTHVTAAVVAMKTITLVLGGLITLYALRAYRRTGAAALRALAIGFGIFTTGTLLAGVVDQFLGYDPLTALVVESMLGAVGFAVILYSLFAED